MLYNSFCASYYFRLLHPGVLVQQQKCPRDGSINVETIKKNHRYNILYLVTPIITKLHICSTLISIFGKKVVVVVGLHVIPTI